MGGWERQIECAEVVDIVLSLSANHMHNRRERERGCYHEGHCGKVLPHSMKLLVAGGLLLLSRVNA